MLQGLRTAVAATSGWEILAVLLALAYLWLATRENILCWYCALVSTAIYTALFWNVSLLMESALNVYYMAMAVYGWYQWRYGGGDAAGVAIGTLRPAQHAIIIGAIIVVAATSGLSHGYAHCGRLAVRGFIHYLGECSNHGHGGAQDPGETGFTG